MTAFLAGELLTAAKLNALLTPAAWTAFTPTWTNLTVGNGTDDCAYFRAGNLVVARYKFTHGSTSAITGTPQATLPITGTSARIGGVVAEYRDVSLPGSFAGFVHVNGTNAVLWLRANVAGATDGIAGLTSTAPFTWATGDTMGATVLYEAA